MKKSIINKIYSSLNKSRLTSHIYRDTDWRGLNNVRDNIIDVAHSLDCVYQYIGSHYAGVIGEVGHRKVYDFEVTKDNTQIHGKMICSFCGTQDDPMGAYDVTVILH